jgi:glycerophosphoryl diester phosphodiesterase
MRIVCTVPCILFLLASLAPAAEPHVIGHRGLILDAPENTLAGFAACLELRIGFELDVRRSKDGRLVCLHDATLDRTTTGKGKVSDKTLEELKKLDAGGWLHPSFKGERVPTLDEVFGLLKERGRDSLVALDLKVMDERLASDLAKLAREHGVTKHLVCIGNAITDPQLRRALRKESAELGVAVLAQTAEDLESALKDESADWAYLRFVPTAAQVAQARQARKKVLVVGRVVMGREPENWAKARAAGVDALLTDYPLECRQLWRKAAAP